MNLQICGLAMADAEEYLCVCGQERTSANLTIRGKDHVWPCGPVAWYLHVTMSFSSSNVAQPLWQS